MILTEEERRRFIEYLTVEADSDEAIVEQMESLRGNFGPVAEVKRQDIAAYRRVAERLKGTESWTA